MIAPWTRPLVIVITIGLAGGVGRADMIEVGKIVGDRYNMIQNFAVGGVSFIAHYELNKNFPMVADCCKKEDLTWLQLADPSKRIQPFPPPPFIDNFVGANPRPDGLPYKPCPYPT